MAQGIMNATPTVLPTTAKTQLGSDIKLPKGVKQILGLDVQLAQENQDAALPVIAKTILESTDVALFNCEFLAPPVPVVLATGGNTVYSKFWPLFVPVTGGETIKSYGQVTLDGTNDPWMSTDIYISDEEPAFPQRKGVVGSVGTLSGTAEVVNDSALEINGGSVLETVYGVAVHAAALAADMPLVITANIISSDLLPPFPIQFMTAWAGGVLSTTGGNTTGPMIEKDVKIAMAQSVSMKMSTKSAIAVTNSAKTQLGVTYV